MKVSVVMPVYNKAPFLREAVESILHGTFTDLELIAVDDKSTDGSLALLRSIADPRLRIIELTENTGPGGAANAGLEAARGEYIVRMDADDIAVPERIALQTAFMDAHPEIGASGGQLQLFGETGDAWPFPTAPDDCMAQLLFGVPLAQPASILRRSVVEQHGVRYGANWPRIGEDWLLWLRMAPFTRFANLSEVLVHYRRGPQNIAYGRDKAADFTLLQREALNALKIPFTEADLDLLVMGLSLFGRTAPTAPRIKALRQLYDRILALNAERHFAPEEAFSRRAELQWDRLFHYLPRYGTSPALMHLRSSGKWPADRLAYLAKYRVNARLGKLPNG